MIEAKGYNILLKANINNIEKIFAGTTYNDVSVAFQLQKIATKADAGAKRYISSGYDVTLTINGLISINENDTDKATNLDRAEMVALAMLQEPFKFYYTLNDNIWTGNMLISDYSESTAADGTANFSIKAKLSGKLSIYSISGSYTLNTLTQSDIVLGLDTQLSATANITATEGGDAYIKFMWVFGGKVVELSDMYTFADGETRDITVNAPMPEGITAGNYTLYISGAVESSISFEVIQPVAITVNKTAVALDFNDNVKILWGDGTVSQGGGSNNSLVNYTHTYQTVPQTLLVYNFVNSNIEFIATNNHWTWDAEISDIKFNNAKLQIASLVIPNTLDNNFNLDIRDVDMSVFQRLIIYNIKTINAENSNINGKISINDTLRILTNINVKNTPNLTFIGDADFGDGLRLWQYGNPRHNIDYLDFSGSKLEQTGISGSTMFLPFNKLRPENIKGDMFNIDSIYLGYNDLGNATTYFDFTNYTNTLKSIYLNNNAMSQLQVDEYCKRVRNHAIAKNVNGGLLQITANSAPSITGQGYINELINNYSWTVNHD